MNTIMCRKTSFAFVLLCFLVNAMPSMCQISALMPKVRTVLTYNVRNATTDDGQVDFADVVSVIL
jgi:hypothetical protein